MLKTSETSILPGKSQKGIPALILNLFVFSGANGLSQLFSVIYSLLLARWLLPEGYGVWAGCYAASAISSFFVNWGMDTWLLRKASVDASPRRLAGSVLAIKGLFGIFWALTVWTLLIRLRPDFYIPTVLALILLDTWVESAVNTLFVLFNAQRRTRTVSGLMVTARALRLVSAAALIWVGQTGVLPFVIVRLVFTTVTLIAALITAQPSWRSSSDVSLRVIWKQSLPYGGSDLLAAIYAQADVFLLSLLAGKVITGSYAPALGLINAVVTLLISAYFYFIPHLSRALKDDPDAFLPMVKRMMAILMAVGLLAAAGIVTLGPWLVMTVLKADYQITGSLLQIMSPILFMKSIGAGSAAVLVAGNRQQERLLPQLISAGINILLNLWAIPRWGAYGSAVVYLLSETVLTIGYATRAFLFLKQSKQA